MHLHEAKPVSSALRDEQNAQLFENRMKEKIFAHYRF
jgi:hypothetical protein